MIYHEFTPIPTPEGRLFPVWRDWDTWAPPGFVARFVYVTEVAPGASKGPVLHTQRTTLLTSFGGHTRISLCPSSGPLTEVSQTLDTQKVVVVPPGEAALIKNESISETALVLVITDLAWTPTSNDQVKFKSWEEFFTWAEGNQT